MEFGLVLFFLFLTAAMLALAAKTIRVVAHARPQNDPELEVTTSADRTALDLNNPSQYLITARYIEGLKDMAKSENARVIFMPVQTSRVLGATGAIRELFTRIGERT